MSEPRKAQLGFVTIVAQNYLAYAQALMASIRRVHATAKTYIVVIDLDFVHPDHSSTYLTAIDLLKDAQIVERQRLRYDVIEFATSLKARALEHVLHDVSIAVFVDPDCMVFGSLEEIVAPALDNQIVLTPHRISPAPLDGLEPSEETIKRYGIFNLGFIAVSKDSLPFLAWWDERLMRYSSISPSQTLFTDQRWIDLVPGYFACSISRHPGANVAPWNLDERKLILTNQGVRVGELEQPLLFAHFSTVGSQFAKGLRELSFELPSHRASRDPENAQAFARLASQWWASVESMREATSLGADYDYAHFPRGQRISAVDRWLFHQRLLKAESRGVEYPALPTRSLVPFHLDIVDRFLGLSSIEGLRAGLSIDLRKWRARKSRRKAQKLG